MQCECNLTRMHLMNRWTKRIYNANEHFSLLSKILRFEEPIPHNDEWRYKESSNIEAANTGETPLAWRHSKSLSLQTRKEAREQGMGCRLGGGNDIGEFRQQSSNKKNE